MSIEPTRENVEKELDNRGVLDTDNEVVDFELVEGLVVIKFGESHILTTSQVERLREFGLTLKKTSPVFVWFSGEVNGLSWEHVEPKSGNEKWFVFTDSDGASGYLPQETEFEVVETPETRTRFGDNSVLADEVYDTVGFSVESFDIDSDYDNGWTFDEMEMVDAEEVPDYVVEQV